MEGTYLRVRLHAIYTMKSRGLFLCMMWLDGRLLNRAVSPILVVVGFIAIYSEWKVPGMLVLAQGLYYVFSDYVQVTRS